MGSRRDACPASESAEIVPSACCGRISIIAAAVKNCRGPRVLNQKTAVAESGAETESMSESDSMRVEPARVSRYTSKLNATSPEVTLLPSCHRAPGWMRNAMDDESDDHFHEVASCFTKPESPIVFIPGPTSARYS